MNPRRMFYRLIKAVVFAISVAWFYFIDDFVLAGPIIAIGAITGPVIGTVVGSILCFVWNVPQTFGFIKLLELGEPIVEPEKTPVAEVKLVKALERFAIWLWNSGGFWGWVRIISMIFFIGPQMALLPIWLSGVRGEEVRAQAMQLVAIYAPLFALPYAVGAYWLRVSIF